MRTNWIWALGLAVACGGRQTDDDGGEAAARKAAPDEWRTPAPAETPPIPPFPDQCSRYQIVRVPRAPGDESRQLNCPCTPTLYFSSLCDKSSCITSINCDALCASIGEPGLKWHDCSGNCEVGQDYGPSQCLQLPGVDKGLFQTSEWCLDDSQCWEDQHCIAVTRDGVRVCRSLNTECNAQSDCDSGSRCALPDDSFLGRCGDGRDGSICFTDADCRKNARCIPRVDSFALSDGGICSTGARGSRCADDGDCSVGHCRFSKCSSGDVHDGCHTSSDCQPGLHCQNWGLTYDPDYALCSDGSVSLKCEHDNDCAAGLYCAQGSCQDGSNHSYCDADEQCASGRCQLASDFPTCTSGEPEALCMDGDDCASGACVRAPGTYDWQSGRCA